METVASGTPGDKPATPMRTVVIASSAGTAFEWYDFFIFGTLLPVFRKNFLGEITRNDVNAGLLVALLIFAIGFLFRPVGAFLFGWLGDRFGRKGTFLATVILMGGATFAIGLLPTSAMIGPAAAWILLGLRIIQGLAVGGEYGGAAIYVAEHAQPKKRGVATSWIQSSAAFGLLGALAVILATRLIIGQVEFEKWGWRIPFLLSAGLVAISVWMRLKLHESPAFKQMKEEGRQSRAPFAEAFLKWKNLKIVLIALVSLMLAQGALWWCTFFYVQTFLETFVKVDPVITNIIMICATVVSIPLYVAFGALSDWIGRKPVLLLGMGLSLVALFPSFNALASGANPALAQAQEDKPVVIHVDRSTCTFQVDFGGNAKYVTPCDVARKVLTDAGVRFKLVDGEAGGAATLNIGNGPLMSVKAGTTVAQFNPVMIAALGEAGYPTWINPDTVMNPNKVRSIYADSGEIKWMHILSGLLILVIAACALYGPLGATMVELFPTNIRYTALSVPYHIGVGWVGGFMPMTAFAIATFTGDIFSGLWYAVGFIAISFVACILLFPETRGRTLVHGS
jgi:MFS family permease